MPIYVYGCNHCGLQFERKQGFHDAPVKICPRCELDVRRITQLVGIVFKGSGWYSTDSRAGSKQSEGEDAAKSGESAKTDGAAKDAGVAADKPASDGADKKATGGDAKPAVATPSPTTSSTPTTTS